jgi:hypothetical protein
MQIGIIVHIKLFMSNVLSAFRLYFDLEVIKLSNRLEIQFRIIFIDKQSDCMYKNIIVCKITFCEQKCSIERTTL